MWIDGQNQGARQIADRMAELAREQSALRRAYLDALESELPMRVRQRIGTYKGLTGTLVKIWRNKHREPQAEVEWDDTPKQARRHVSPWGLVPVPGAPTEHYRGE